VEAAIVGAGERLRPILMTACAMSVGMVPMALALERGSQMQAPLGRAVIGGLVMSTFATLLVLPSVFAIVLGNRKAKSPSMYPDDPESDHYDPHVFDKREAGHHEGGHGDAAHAAEDGDEPPEGDTARHGGEAPRRVPSPIAPDPKFAKEFPWNPTAIETDPFVTHHAQEELLNTLGFAPDDIPPADKQAAEDAKSPPEEKDEK
jgi:hypothetical protein